MKLPWRLKLSRPAERPFLVLDLGTARVKAAVLRVKKEGPEEQNHLVIEEKGEASPLHLEVLGAAEQKHGQHSFRGRRPQQLDAVLETTSLAVEKASLEAGINPRRAVFLASGLIRIINTKVKLQRTDPKKPIREGELDRILQEVEQRVHPAAEKKAILKLGPTKEENSTPLRLKVKSNNFYLDGKSLSSPLEFSGRELRLTFSEEFCSREEKEILEELAANLGLEVFHWSSPALSAISFLRNFYPRGIIVDIGGNFTEVTLFYPEQIEGGAGFNWGSEHLNWLLMREFDLTLDQSEKLKQAWADNKLERDKENQLKGILKYWLQILFLGLEEALGDLASGQSLPEHFLLCGGGSFIPHLRSAFLAYPWNKNLNFAVFPKPHLIQPLNHNFIRGRRTRLNNPAWTGVVGAAIEKGDERT